MIERFKDCCLPTSRAFGVAFCLFAPRRRPISGLPRRPNCNSGARGQYMIAAADGMTIQARFDRADFRRYGAAPWHALSCTIVTAIFRAESAIGERVCGQSKDSSPGQACKIGVVMGALTAAPCSFRCNITIIWICAGSDVAGVVIY